MQRHLKICQNYIYIYSGKKRFILEYPSSAVCATLTTARSKELQLIALFVIWRAQPARVAQLSKPLFSYPSILTYFPAGNQKCASKSYLLLRVATNALRGTLMLGYRDRGLT